MNYLRYAFLLLILAYPQFAVAREMEGRLGLGYNSQFAGNLAGISFKYGWSREIALAAIVAVDTKSPFSHTEALKVFRNLFYEPHLNFYFVTAIASVRAQGVSGLDLQSGLGAEAFWPGIESLGFSIEAGASFNNRGGSYALQTVGVSFLNAGIHFYF